MTRTLILIRHAKSDWGDPLLGDHERTLNDRGRRDAPRVGRWLADHAPAPDAVLCSDAARTRETWDMIAAHWPGTPAPQLRADLYLAPPARMLKLAATSPADTLVIVAHNPGIGDLANTLGTSDHPRFADYPTGAAAVFDMAGPRPALVSFATPHDLPA